MQISRLVQVCADISNPKTLKREMRALIKASQELRCDELILLNDRVSRTEVWKWREVELKIKLMPLWQWLLEPASYWSDSAKAGGLDLRSR